MPGLVATRGVARAASSIEAKRQLVLDAWLRWTPALGFRLGLGLGC